MFIVMSAGHSEQELGDIIRRLKEMGFTGHVSQGVERTVIGVVGQTYPELKDTLETWLGVDEVVPISKPHKLASRELQPRDTTIKMGSVTIGGGTLTVMAGPCAVESEQQLMTTARAVKEAGAHILRGGAFKPSTSPYTFRGLGEDGLKLLAQAREETGMPVVTEVMTVRDVEMVSQYADILQIGARNMQNFNLLDEVGMTKKPVMLKRGLSATIQEWLLSAEYILAQGNKKVLLCARGIRTFETYTRNTMDLDAIPIIKKLSHLPVIADPSHGTGKWELVTPMSMAAVAAGADGLMVEVHPSPETALKDGPQSLNFGNFQQLMANIRPIAKAVGREVV
jgi:3-deoxy-7-phosphoheptulonate synthase